ncbi:MAG: ATP-binding protein [Myxococcota bacterium]
MGTVFALTLAYAVAMRRGRVTGRFARLQVLGDVLLVSAVVFVTGGADSPFTFLMPLAVLLGTVTLMQEGALLSAAGTAIAFNSMMLGQQLGWWRPPIGRAVLPWSEVIFVSSGTITAQFLVAALSGYLARQVVKAGGRVTQRDERIRSLLDLQHQIVSSMPSGLLTCDRDHVVTFVNPAGGAILGLADRLEGRALRDVLPGLVCGPGGVQREELVVTTSRGDRTLGLSATPLPGDDGGWLVVFQDLTELREKESQLRRADHLASLGKVSAQLAHELRNPLAAMRGAAQLLSSTDRVEDVARLTQILVRESDRLNRLVDDFLRFSRPPPQRLERVDLGRLASDVVELMRTDPLARGVGLEVDAPSPVWAVVDRSQFEQVLLNLVRNAAAALEHRGAVRLCAREEGGSSVLTVWDSAGSIPPEALGRLFEPFFSMRPGGTGLGLSTAYAIVRAHGGDIRVRSQPDIGTEFRITLDAAGANRAGTP